MSKRGSGKRPLSTTVNGLEDSVVVNKKAKRSQVSVNQTQDFSFNESVRCGKIIHMHLENFMCHSNLSVEFGSRVNFLVGNNGSGKSAVLTALVLGLGSNARTTNRSTNIQKLIKIGENSAKVEITLENGGPRGYHPEEYGERITIVRLIRHSGSSYCMKDASGNVITRKVEDLRRMLLYFNIRVENPIFVLNQDSAREFLKDLEPKKNYQLFLKASQLDIIMESLGDCRDMRQEQLKQLTAFEDKLKIDEEIVKELEIKLNMIRSVEEMKSLLKKFEISLSWCEVQKHESDLKTIKAKISTIEESKQKYEKHTNNKDAMEQQLAQKISKFNVCLAELTENYQTQEKIVNEKKRNVGQVNIRLRGLEAKTQNDQKQIKHLQQCLNDLEMHMKTCDEDRNKAAELKQRNLAAIENCKEKLADSDAIIESAKRDLKLFHDNKLQCTEKVMEVIREKESVESNMNRIVGIMSRLNGNTRNKLSVFGEDIAMLVHDIETMYKERRFSQMPRGPIGQYIEVPNSKYRDLVEHQLGPQLRSFIVSNSKDRTTLNELIQRKYPRLKVPIITTKFEEYVYDVRRGSVRPPPNTRLLMDEIHCKDPVVMNLLIDTQGIETILITESKSVAEELTSEVENVPPHLRRVLVPQLGMEYVAAPNYAMYSLKINPARFIQVDVRDRIRQLEEELADCKNRSNKLNKTIQEMKKTIQEHDQKIREKRNLIEFNESNKRDMINKIHELETFVYPPQNEMDVLEKEYSEINSKLEDVNERISEITDEISSLKTTITEAEIDLQETQKKLSDLNAQKQKIEEEREQVKMEMRNLDYNMDQIMRKLKASEELLESQLQQCREIERKLEKARTEAQSKGDYIETDETEVTLTEKIRTFKAKIRQRATLLTDSEEVVNALAIKRDRLKSDIERIKNIRKSIDQLKRSWLRRVDLFTRLQQHTAMSVWFVFSQILKVRHFDGVLDIDHKKRTIEVKVTPHASGEKSGMSNTRALSGGERSFTTVALLKSLWSCSSHPFYFLDEYDVFTDEVNREIITQLLIQEGEHNPDRQFCFLTPQDTQVASKSYIKVHKLAEPVRGVSDIPG